MIVKLIEPIKYRCYMINVNASNIYNYKPCTYILQHEDETDGRADYGETIDECINKINEIYEDE